MSRSGRRRAAASVGDGGPIDLSQDDEDTMPLSSLASLARSVKREEYKDSPHTQPNSTQPSRQRGRLATQAQRDRRRRQAEEAGEGEEDEEGEQEGGEEQKGEEREEAGNEELEHEEKQQPASPSSPPPLSPNQPSAASASSSSAAPSPYSSYFNSVPYHQLASTLSQRQQHNTQLQRALQHSSAQLAALSLQLPPQLAAQLTADYHASIEREAAVGGGMGQALEAGRRLMEAGEVSWQTRWEEKMGAARAEGDEKGRDALARRIEQADAELAEKKVRQQRERDRQQQRQRDRQQGRVGEDGDEKTEVQEAEDEGEGEQEEEGEAHHIILPLSQSQPQSQSASGRARLKRERGR